MDTVHKSIKHHKKRIILDENPSLDFTEGYTVDEVFDEVGKKLIAHFGEDFRLQVNESRTKCGMLPL